jgi:hypothetical protein
MKVTATTNNPGFQAITVTMVLENVYDAQSLLAILGRLSFEKCESLLLGSRHIGDTSTRSLAIHGGQLLDDVYNAVVDAAPSSIPGVRQ